MHLSTDTLSEPSAPHRFCLPRASDCGANVPLGRLGTLEIRLAATDEDVRAAQRLRYAVFYEEGPARADAAARITRRDADAFDSACDHLLVLDHAAGGAPQVVGTYRLLRKETALRHGGFYSSSEFAVEPLIARHPHLRMLELGRSCVLAPYRNRRTVELLWHGVWSYVLAHRIDVMFGCASLDGENPERHALPLSFLHHFASAPESWRVRALGACAVRMDLVPRAALDVKAALRSLPPLIKGYLRLGAFVGDGAVIDRRFGTTDVFVVLPVAGIDSRYVRHFGPAAERHAA